MDPNEPPESPVRGEKWALYTVKKYWTVQRKCEYDSASKGYYLSLQYRMILENATEQIQLTCNTYRPEPVPGDSPWQRELQPMIPQIMCGKGRFLPNVKVWIIESGEKVYLYSVRTGVSTSLNWDIDSREATK